MASKTQYALTIAIAGKVASSLKKSTDSATKEMTKLQKVAAGVGKGVAIGFSAATTAIVAVGKELMDVGTKFDDAYDKIRIGTGATGEQLEALQTSMNNVYSQVPAEIDDCAQAIADYNTRLGVTGDTLETLSTQAIQASDMLGEDLTGMIEGSSQAMQQWGVAEDDMSAKMDYMFKVSQSTGTGMTELFNEMQTYGSQLQDMGYDFENAAALLGQLDKAGVNTTEVLSAMKKSVTTMAKDGLSASEGMEQYVDQIKNAKTATEATAIASEVFGSRAASTMSAAIRNGTLDVEDFTKALQESDETISKAAWDTYDFPEQLQMMKNQLEVSLQPAGSMLFSSISEAMPTIMGVLEEILPVVTDTVSSLLPIIQSIFGAIDFDTLADIVMSVVEVVGPILESVASVLPDIMNQAMSLLTTVLPIIQALGPALTPLIDALLQLVISILPAIQPLLGPAVQLITALLPVLTMVADLITGLTPAITAVLNIVSSVAGNVINSLQPVISGVTLMLQGIIDFITGVFSGSWSDAWTGICETFSGIWDTIKGACAGAINIIISLLNGLIDGINKIHIGPLPNWKVLGEYAGADIGFNIGHIPEVAFAEGGIVTQPTHALIGEAGESEAVLPLSKLDSMIGGIGTGETVITFAPVINCSSGDVAEIEDTLSDEFEKFKTYMDMYIKQNRRLSFSR